MERLTPLKAIRAKCIDCCCGNTFEVRECPCEDCPLWAFRDGHNPNIQLSDEQKALRAARLTKIAEKQRQSVR